MDVWAPEPTEERMTDELLWSHARALYATLRHQLADDQRWCVWSVEPVRLDDGQIVPMVLLQDQQAGTFHLIPTPEAWVALRSRA